MFNSLNLLLIIFFVSGNCFALSSEEFDKQYQYLNAEKTKAVLHNMTSSRNYDDKKVPLSEKIESKSAWCDLIEARLNLLDFVSQNFSAYQVWLKQNNLEDDSSEDDVDNSIKMWVKSYIGCMENLKEFEKSKLKN